jgi:hypothetical protein
VFLFMACAVWLAALLFAATVRAARIETAGPERPER